MKSVRRLILLSLAGLGLMTLLGTALIGMASRVGLQPPAIKVPDLLPAQLDSDTAQASRPAAQPGLMAAPPLAGPSVAAPRAAERSAAPAPQTAIQPSSIDFGQRLIVRTANVVLLVEDVPEVSAQAGNLAVSLNGFVVSSTQREENGRPAATVTIRIPAERFEEAMDKLRGLAVRVSNEQVSSRDVTEEFVDTDARLRNLRATEARYLDLLQQARSVEDVLKVEQQLSNIRGQIEQLQGRLQFLRRSAETSLISLELRPYAVGQSSAPDWSLLPVLRNAWGALLNTIQVVLSVLVWTAVFAPIWLPVLFLVWRWQLRRLMGQGSAAGSATPVARA